MQGPTERERTRGRILLVDDTPATLLVLTNLLTEQGYVVNPAEEGALALAFTESVLPDLILLDVRMPGMDGFEVCARLKRNPRTRDIPVIFLTSSDRPDDKVRAFHCGAVDYISKPFEPEEVLARIDTHLTLARLRRGLEETVRERTAELQEEIRERVQADKALRASERRFATAFQASPIFMSITSLDEHRFLYVNEELTRATGYSAAELIGRRAPELNLWSDQKAIDDLVAPLKEQGRIHNAEGTLLTRAGERRAMLFSVEVIEVDGRGCALFAAVDVTEQKEAEEARRHLTRELRALSDCNQVLLRAVDEPALLNDICRIICEEAGYRMAWVGYAENDAARSVRPVAWEGADDAFLTTANITWADQPRGRGPTGTAIRCGDTACIQDFAADPLATPWRGEALERGYRSAIALPLKDGNARIFGALTIYSADVNAFTADEVRLLEELAADLAFGITVLRAREERKVAEEALRESEQRYKLLLGSVTDYIFTVRVENGRPVATTHGPGCAAVTGYTPDEFAADPGLWLSMVHEPDRASVIQQAERLLAGEPAPPVEHRIRHRDGSLRWVRNTPVCHYDQERRLIAYDGLIADISEHRRAEEEQATLRQHLQEAQKMEAIGRLAGGVAHDFNNLLTVINGYCELALRRLKKGDPLVDDLERIQTAGRRATDLTQQLLAFSRKQVVRIKVINLNDQVRDAERMLERLIGEDIELICTLDPALGMTKADPGQVHQILMNLAVNARDAMPSGGRLVLQTENEEVGLQYAAGRGTLEPGSYVVLSVSDTGLGMTEEVKSHVFEPFFTTKEPGKGTGLGLATVFGIVQQAGGYVSFSSQLDKGTAFRIFLPRVTGPEENQFRPERPERRLGGTETILVVEDQRAVRQLTCTMLRSLGYRVLEAANGGEALLACESHADPIHLMITDVVMPQMSGPDLAAHLRALRPEVRSLYMSGYSEGGGLRRESVEGTADYLQKPFSLEGLADKVREILDRSGRAEPAGDGAPSAEDGL
jgi:PAS domain S-box-containing protein